MESTKPELTISDKKGEEEAVYSVKPKSWTKADTKANVMNRWKALRAKRKKAQNLNRR